eukprot:842588-Rhodomonas_salina.1
MSAARDTTVPGMASACSGLQRKVSLTLERASQSGWSQLHPPFLAGASEEAETTVLFRLHADAMRDTTTTRIGCGVMVDPVDSEGGNTEEGERVKRSGAPT